MNGNIIQLSHQKVTLIDKGPKKKGAPVVLNIDLPNGAIIDSFPLNVTVTECEKISINGNMCYLLEMEIGDILKENREILQGYLEYVNRDDRINLINSDVKFNEILEAVQQ